MFLFCYVVFVFFTIKKLNRECWTRRPVAEGHVIYLPIVYIYWLPWFAGVPYSGRRACDLFAYCLHVLIAMVKSLCRRPVQWQKSTWSICLLSTCTDCHGLQAFRTVAEEHVIYLPIVCMYWLPWFAGVPYSGRGACDLFAHYLHVLVAMVCRRSVQWQRNTWRQQSSGEGTVTLSHWGHRATSSSASTSLTRWLSWF